MRPGRPVGGARPRGLACECGRLFAGTCTKWMGEPHMTTASCTVASLTDTLTDAPKHAGAHAPKVLGLNGVPAGACVYGGQWVRTCFHHPPASNTILGKCWLFAPLLGALSSSCGVAAVFVCVPLLSVQRYDRTGGDGGSSSVCHGIVFVKTRQVRALCCCACACGSVFCNLRLLISFLIKSKTECDYCACVQHNLPTDRPCSTCLT